MLWFLKDILAPKKCYSCKKEWRFLCEVCIQLCQKYEPSCYVCKRPTSHYIVCNLCQKSVYYSSVMVLFHYRDTLIQRMIKDFKFYSKKDIGIDLWLYMSELFFENEIYKNPQDYVIIYPPLDIIKRLKRWYNQSYILSKTISNHTNIPIASGILSKKINTRQQSLLSRHERIDNIKDSFKINKKHIDKIDNKKCIIVDDVISTGSTVNEIAKILKQAWTQKIICFTIASD